MIDWLIDCNCYISPQIHSMSGAAAVQKMVACCRCRSWTMPWACRTSAQRLAPLFRVTTPQQANSFNSAPRFIAACVDSDLWPIVVCIFFFLSVLFCLQEILGLWILLIKLSSFLYLSWHVTQSFYFHCFWRQCSWDIFMVPLKKQPLN